jgi:hypothetical protein
MILIAEILDPASIQRNPELTEPQYQPPWIDRQHIALVLLVALLSLILITAGLWISLH